MKLTGILQAAAVATLFAAASLSATTLASYPFTGSSLASTDPATFSSASDIVLDTGLTDTTGRFTTANGNPAPALRVNTDETDGTSFATANIANDDFTFTITPVSGGKLVLDTLTFDLAVSSAAVDSSVRIQLSGTGTVFTTLATISDFTTTTFTAESYSLTAANTALATGLPIYVRFLVFDAANNANAYTAFDNISVSGAVAAIVPEPGTNALLALGAAGVLLRRRRQAGI